MQAEVEMSAGLYGSKDCIMHFVRTFWINTNNHDEAEGHILL